MPVPEGDDIEIGCSGAYTWETTTYYPLGGDHGAGPWQRTGGIGERRPAHPDDTLRGAFQQRWKTGSPCMVAGPL